MQRDGDGDVREREMVQQHTRTRAGRREEGGRGIEFTEMRSRFLNLGGSRCLIRGGRKKSSLHYMPTMPCQSESVK